jgi:capsule biosynthesis phosphatase
MKLYILCGGSGERLKSYSYPKPLNMIYGKPSIYYSLQYIPSSFKTFHFIYSSHLCEYNFENIIINLFKDRICKFKCIDYFTRGPVESAYLGIKDTVCDGEPIMFLDNDNIYRFPDTFYTNTIDSAFIGCNIDKSGSEAFSYIQLNGSNIINIKEKCRISDTYCIGIYGFKNINQFTQLASALLLDKFKGEAYMSSVYEKMISEKMEIKRILFPTTTHIGTLKEINDILPFLGKEKIRVCFDLDNTLVTYPSIPGDYTTVLPIEPMISLARSLHEDGHTIIIYTARRMKTHSGNVGATIRDIGAITFITLDNFQIPYDELIFGKPIADIYIDDRAVNPYRNDLKSMGLFINSETKQTINFLPSNKYNNIHVVNNNVIKSGNADLLRGQLFFYKNIPVNSSVSAYFPKMYKNIEASDIVTMELEYIKGIPLYTLFKHEMISVTHINKIMDMVQVLHNTYSPVVSPSIYQITNNYINKFIKRLSNKDLYPFGNCREIISHYLEKLEEYCKSARLTSVNIIHGDLWLSNMILAFNGDIKFIDMRGEVDGVLTLGGDPLYDYAKIYQSLRGYDALLYGHKYNSEYAETLIGVFRQNLLNININIDDVIMISDILILGSFHAIDDLLFREKCWKWICSSVIV